jgi:3-dehydroquinate synthase
LGQYAASAKKPCKATIISDSNVWPIYGKKATDSLIAAGFEVNNFIFPAGESSKNGQVYLEILNELAALHMTRSDLLIALGGGVVGDMTGFVAATYLRGISFIQVPTTLLAMVDSSVGGKTAIDLPAGKNLAGAFYQPDLVLCDIDALVTLPADIFRDGCAEVIKYGILYDPHLFEHLQNTGLNFDREYVVTRCVELKRDVVADDEFDRGNRQKLNLGHTIGHGIEASSHFGVSHGFAVAAGIGIVTKAAEKNGICSAETFDRIISVLNFFGLPTQTTYTAEDIYKWALSDKKRSGATVNLIVPRKIGECLIVPTATEDLKLFIEAGL